MNNFRAILLKQINRIELTEQEICVVNIQIHLIFHKVFLRLTHYIITLDFFKSQKLTFYGTRQLGPMSRLE